MWLADLFRVEMPLVVVVAALDVLLETGCDCESPCPGARVIFACPNLHAVLCVVYAEIRIGRVSLSRPCQQEDTTASDLLVAPLVFVLESLSLMVIQLVSAA
jgi:hypothetical protein